MKSKEAIMAVKKKKAAKKKAAPKKKVKCKDMAGK